MSMSAFAHATAAAGGGTAELAVALDASYSASDIDPTSPYSSSAGFLISNSGSLSRQEGGAYTSVNGWLASGTPSDAQVSITKTSGNSTATGMVDGQWYTCSSSYEFAISSATVGSYFWNGTLSFRLAVSPFTVLDTATISLTLDNEA